MSISGAAAISAGRVQTQIQMALLSKVMQQVKCQQEGVAGLIDAAVESAQQIQGSEPGKGVSVDVFA